MLPQYYTAAIATARALQLQYQCRSINCMVYTAAFILRLQVKSPPIYFSFGIIRFWREPCHCSLFNFPSIKLRPDKHNNTAVPQFKCKFCSISLFVPSPKWLQVGLRVLNTATNNSVCRKSPDQKLSTESYISIKKNPQKFAIFPRFI